jgi:hypothetical protein
VEDLEILHTTQNDEPSNNCICEHLRKHYSEELRLDVVLENRSLKSSDLMPKKRTLGQAAFQEPIDLGSILAASRKHWTQQSNWVLAVVLAYSLFYLRDMPQTARRWTRRNIFFLANNHRIPLRPFFRAHGPEGTAQALHGPDPEILELAVVLLEIQIGEGLEAYLDLNSQISDGDSLYWKACDAYYKEEQHFEKRTSVIYQEVVKTCLTPGTFKNRDPEELRMMLFERVIKPLEEQLGEILPEILASDNMDEDAAKRFDLALSMASTSSNAMMTPYARQQSYQRHMLNSKSRGLRQTAHSPARQPQQQ